MPMCPYIEWSSPYRDSTFPFTARPVNGISVKPRQQVKYRGQKCLNSPQCTSDFGPLLTASQIDFPLNDHIWPVTHIGTDRFQNTNRYPSPLSNNFFIDIRGCPDRVPMRNGVQYSYCKTYQTSVQRSDISDISEHDSARLHPKLHVPDSFEFPRSSDFGENDWKGSKRGDVAP